MPWLCKPVSSIWYQYQPILASFPGLHAQLLSLAVQKVGEGLDGFITWCVPQLTSCTVASHDRSSSNLNRRTNWTEERTEFRERRVKGREQTQTWADWTWRQLQHASCDKSVQAFPLLFVLQSTKARCGGLGTRLGPSLVECHNLGLCNYKYLTVWWIFLEYKH